MGIEPTCPAWKAGALPLSYTRKRISLKPYNSWVLFFVTNLIGRFLYFSISPSGGSRIRTCEG